MTYVCGCEFVFSPVLHSSYIPVHVLRLRRGLSAPMTDRPKFGFGTSSERSTKHMWRVFTVCVCHSSFIYRVVTNAVQQDVFAGFGDSLLLLVRRCKKHDHIDWFGNTYGFKIEG